MWVYCSHPNRFSGLGGRGLVLVCDRVEIGLGFAIRFELAIPKPIPFPRNTPSHSFALRACLSISLLFVIIHFLRKTIIVGYILHPDWRHATVKGENIKCSLMRTHFFPPR